MDDSAAREWVQEYQLLPPDESQQQVYLAAVEYHRRCEEYDTTVCTGPNGRPANGRELGLIGKHALAVRAELACELGVCEALLHRAIQQVSREQRSRRN